RTTNGDRALLIIDLQSAAADDADLAHLPADERSMRRSAAERRENAVRRLHAADVFGRSLAAHQDDAALGIALAVSVGLAVLVDVLFSVVGEELDDAGGRPRPRVDALGN